MKKRNRKTDGKGKNVTKLLVAMTGKASAAKAAEGDKPVFAYIASLPQSQRSIAERVDALAANTLPNLQRAVKWGWRTTEWAEAGAFRHGAPDIADQGPIPITGPAKMNASLLYHM
jgi:hypothetical protein